MNKIEIYNSPKILAEETAIQFIKIVNESLKTEPYFYCAVSGGNTPKLFFEKLTGDSHRGQIDWSKIHFFWADERMVPPDNTESNFGEAKKILFDHIPIPPENIHRIKGESNPQHEVFRYAAEIREKVKKDKNNFPRFDLIFLGIGEDGHTASLFPGKVPDITDEKNVCGLTENPKNRQLRITLTKETINNGKRIIFLVTGNLKAVILSDILKNSPETKNSPAALIRPVNGTIKWIIDKDAAKFLNKKYFFE